ncbi:MAG TPA: LysM peptidoglycan-binding domain-containing protein [Luteolibacter sp.]|nr:LysM peptidoglycan-binding domain-containing protein [Luteolibacter sp.]
MKHIHLSAAAVMSALLVSCASQKADTYDTDPYGYPDASLGQAPAQGSENPVYDTPAAYEEASAYTPAEPAAPEPSAPATIHTVVRGDTLSGLSAKYKVPMESIKRANNMTNDIVVLGRNMVIPAR